MRIFFCLMPANVVFGLVFGFGVLALKSDPTHALVAASAFGAAMFLLGWQVTDPKREAERDKAAQSAAQKGQP